MERRGAGARADLRGSWRRPWARALASTCLVLVAACAGAPTAAPPAAGADAERAVWEALLRQHYVRRGDRVVVLDPVVGYEDPGLGPPALASGELWRAFLAANRRERRLPADLAVGVPVAWFAQGDWWALRRSVAHDHIEATWDAFHARFPGSGGHISLSGVGFGADGRHALVFGFVGSASLSASGDFFLLRRTSGGWRIVDSVCTVMA